MNNKSYRNIILILLIISWALITIALLADIENQLSMYLLISGIVLAVAGLVIYIWQEFKE